MSMVSDRVEPKQMLVGRGMGTTPERLEEIQRRAKELERLRPAKPSRAFASLMTPQPKTESPIVKVRGPGPNLVPEVNSGTSPKETRQKKLPKKGPRPSLLHPGQQQGFGREAADDVVLKG